MAFMLSGYLVMKMKLMILIIHTRKQKGLEYVKVRPQSPQRNIK